jgi:hypothetical protein
VDLRLPLYLLSQLTNDEDLISHIEILSAADDDQEKFKIARRVAETKKNGEVLYMLEVLRIVNIG